MPFVFSTAGNSVSAHFIIAFCIGLNAQNLPTYNSRVISYQGDHFGSFYPSRCCEENSNGKHR